MFLNSSHRKKIHICCDGYANYPCLIITHYTHSFKCCLECHKNNCYKTPMEKLKCKYERLGLTMPTCNPGIPEAKQQGNCSKLQDRLVYM